MNSKKLLKKIENLKIKTFLFEFSHIINIEDKFFIKIGCMWRIYTQKEIIFIDGTKKDLSILKHANLVLSNKQVKKIVLNNYTRDLRIYLEDEIVIDLFSTYHKFENWEINSEYGNLVSVFNEKPIFYI